MNLYIVAGILALGFFAILWAFWRGRKGAEAKAEAGDARLRAEAGRASQEAYHAEKDKNFDPRTGRPYRRL